MFGLKVCVTLLLFTCYLSPSMLMRCFTLCLKALVSVSLPCVVPVSPRSQYQTQQLTYYVFEYNVYLVLILKLVCLAILRVLK